MTVPDFLALADEAERLELTGRAQDMPVVAVGVTRLRELIAALREACREIERLRSIPLTAVQARMLKVCRICRGEPTAPFIYNYGREHAHESCLQQVAGAMRRPAHTEPPDA